MDLFHIFFHRLSNIGFKMIRSSTFIVTRKDKIYGKSIWCLYLNIKKWTLVQYGSWGRARTGNLEVNSFLLHHWATQDYSLIIV